MDVGGLDVAAPLKDRPDYRPCLRKRAVAAMATPDTSDLTSSSEVFTTYTLPQIRAIHKSLHVQIEEKAARLRTQVGNSYRDLLGTADTIVQMRHDMSQAQNILGDMGGRCGRTVVGGKVSGLAKFRGLDDAEAEMGCVARVKLLEACDLAVARLLKGNAPGRGERLVLAAKVLVLSRLLVSSFHDAGPLKEELRVAVEAARKNLGHLRRRLLRGVEKALGKLGEEGPHGDMLQVLCAYSLASSSGARDVLRHCLNVRAEAMTYEFDVEDHERDKGTDNVLRGLDLYTRTLLDVQALVPSKLSNALAELKKKPLLADESIQALEGLRLDIYKRWCGDEIQYFTPFIRHDDLEGKQAKEMLTAWAKKGSEALLGGVKTIMEHMHEFKAIVDLRTSVLQRWIKDGGKARGFDPSTMLDGLRETINGRLLDVLDTKITKLRLVGSEVAATLDAWRPGNSDQRKRLWDEEMLDLDMTVSSAQVTHEILSRLHGQNDAVARAVTGYESWYRLINDVNEVVDQLRRQRWDNDVEEIEDEETIEERQTLLSRDDPRKIEERLNAALEQSFKQLDEHLGALWQEHTDSPGRGHIAMYLLRLLRSIRSRLPQVESTKSFGLAYIPSLNESLVAQVALGPLEEFSTTALTKERVTGRALWEGEPALPTQPSLGTFKLLRSLVSAMGDAGLDLWNPTAIRALKDTLGAQLCEAWRAALAAGEDERKEKEAKAEEVREASADGETSPEDGANVGKETEATREDETNKQDGANEGRAASPGATKPEPPSSAGNDAHRADVVTHWVYDMMLLEIYLGTAEESHAPLAALADEVFATTGLEKAAKERMRKASREYWKRTSLLFGLLA